MSRFVFVNTILPGKTQQVKEMFQTIRDKDNNGIELEERTYAQNIMGVTSWNSWIQHTPTGDLMIQCYQGSCPEAVFAALREGIQEGYPLALRKRTFHLEVTGEDLADPTTTPKITEMLSLEFPKTKWSCDEYFCIGFAWPLLKGKTEAHEEFCNQEKNENFDKLASFLKPYEITTFMKFIQKTPEQDYIVYYFEFPKDIYTKIFGSSNKILTTGNNDPSSNKEWPWISKALKEHTGLSGKQLFPDLESVEFDQIVIEPPQKADVR